MTKFLINIWAYNYHGKFEIESNDNAKDVATNHPGEDYIEFSDGSWNDIYHHVTRRFIIEYNPTQIKDFTYFHDIKVIPLSQIIIQNHDVVTFAKLMEVVNQMGEGGMVLMEFDLKPASPHLAIQKLKLPSQREVLP